MSRDYILIIISWIAVICLLIKFIPKDKIRYAYIAFTFKQLLTWVIGFSVAELGLIEYPVRLFPNAAKASFTFEYFLYPSLCAIFNIHFPVKKSFLSKSMYYIYYCTAMTIIEEFIVRYTNIIKYTHWAWYATWITLFLTFFMTRRFYVWYLKLDEN